MATWVGYPRSYTPGRNRPVQYVVIHATESGEALNAAENGAAYDKIRTDGTSTHLFVDPDTALQEVPFGDRAHAARFHGNEIGIQIELCGYAGQTWAQWHDAASTAELQLAAKEVAAICRIYAIPPRHLTVAEVRAAYYNAPGSRPKGICSHDDVTRAYPEDGGTHTDPGPNYPWDEFLAMVRAELAPVPEAVMAKTLIINEVVQGPAGPIAAGALYGAGGAGFFHIHSPEDATRYGKIWGIDPFAAAKYATLEAACHDFGPFLGEYNAIIPGPKGDPGPPGPATLVPHDHEVPAGSTGPAVPA